MPIWPYVNVYACSVCLSLTFEDLEYKSFMAWIYPEKITPRIKKEEKKSILNIWVQRIKSGIYSFWLPLICYNLFKYTV